MNKIDKLETLAGAFGFADSDAMLEETAFQSIVPAICIADDCDYTTDMEPDQDRGWCEICNKNTVQSCLILAGII